MAAGAWPADPAATGPDTGESVSAAKSRSRYSELIEMTSQRHVMRVYERSVGRLLYSFLALFPA
jgi:hypothetical protein